MSLADGVRWSVRDKDAGSARSRRLRARLRTKLSGRAARPGGTVVISSCPPREMRGVVQTSIEATSGLPLGKEVSWNVSRASLHIFAVTAVLLLASIAGMGFPDGP